jgi:hypothetical protein
LGLLVVGLARLSFRGIGILASSGVLGARMDLWGRWGLRFRIRIVVPADFLFFFSGSTCSAKFSKDGNKK